MSKDSKAIAATGSGKVGGTYKEKIYIFKGGDTIIFFIHILKFDQISSTLDIITYKRRGGKLCFIDNPE